MASRRPSGSLQLLLPLLLLAVAMLCAPSAAHAANNSTLLAVASSQPNLSILAAALQRCPPLTAAASQASTAVTVFAPTNAAFGAAFAALNTSAEALLANEGLLCSILEYHVAVNVLTSQDALLAFKQLIVLHAPAFIALQTLLPLATVTLTVVNTSYDLQQHLMAQLMVNNATILAADIEAGASLVHVIDKVLLPPFLLPTPAGSIAQVASSVPDLSTLVSALFDCQRLYSQATAISGSAVTVFAPTNKAFTDALHALNITVSDLLLNNNALLCDILAYHFVPGAIPSVAATSNLASVQTQLQLPGGSTYVNIQRVNGKVKVNDATVLTADIKAGPGASLVHIIDKVLLPPNLADFLPNSTAAVSTIFQAASHVADLSTLVSVLSACPALASAARDPVTAVTVFAPTNKAFADALVALGLSKSALLGNRTLLCPILEYHIVGSSAITAEDAISSLSHNATALPLPTLLPFSILDVSLVGGSNGTLKVNDANVLVTDIKAGTSIIHIIDRLLLPPFLLPTAPGTIARVASSVADLSTLVSAVHACPLVLQAASNPATAVTVFAPTNEAFNAFEDILDTIDIYASDLVLDQTLLCAVLEYHIVSAVLPSSAATSTLRSVPTLLAGSNITVQSSNGTVKVNDASVQIADVKAGASVVHVIDKVLLPPFLGIKSIVSVASSVPELSTLVAAVSACPALLAAATDPTTSVTVFAPTNEAFVEALAALNMSASTLLGNQTLLCAILEYHIAPVAFATSLVSENLLPFPTLLFDAEIRIQQVNGTVKVNNVSVITADVKAGPSFVNIIDKVLLPPFLLPDTIDSVASKNPSLSSFLSLVDSCRILHAAALDPATAVTVFAPTNKALQAAFTGSDIFEALLTNRPSLCATLAYHIVPAVIPSTAATKTAISVPTLLPRANVTIQLVRGKVKVNDATVKTADVKAGASIIHIIDQLLVPPFLDTNNTIASVASSMPDLSMLLTVVKASPDILKVATNPKSVLTVWAPTNAAFAAAIPMLTKKLGISTAQLLNNSKLVTAILSYHVSPAPLVQSTAFAKSSKTINTLLKSNPLVIKKAANKDLLVGAPVAAFASNAAKVLLGDVHADFSVIHVIDKVLLPLNWESVFSKLV